MIPTKPTTRDDLARALEARGIPARTYRIDGSIHDEGYTLLEEGPVWVVFASERGKRIDERLCYSEAEGCALLYDWLIRSPAPRDKR